MDYFKKAVVGLSDIVGATIGTAVGVLPGVGSSHADHLSGSYLAVPNSPGNSGHTHENTDASHQEQSDWWLVSLQSESNDFDMSIAEQCSENTSASLQQQTEWCLVSQKSASNNFASSREAGGKHSYNKCLWFQLKLGSVTEEEADVLVSSVGRDLKLSRGVISSCMLMKAGDAMQHELYEHFPNGIEEFEFADSSAHRLPCKRVLHVACGHFTDEISKMNFASVLCRCLQYADDAHMKSVAFPPIGTGALGYAPQMVAELFYEAIIKFLKSCSNQNLEVVTLAVFDCPAYQIFKSTLDRLMQDNMAVSENRPNVSPTESVSSDMIPSSKESTRGQGNYYSETENPAPQGYATTNFERQFLSAGVGEGENGIVDSCRFVLLSLHVDSGVHITEHCLGELTSFLDDRRYSLHDTEVPGELVLEWHCPTSERENQLVVRRICQYADHFCTAVVEISEQLADEKLRAFLKSPQNADMSWIKIDQRSKDHLYMITGKKKFMSRLHHWLPRVKPVHYSLLVPFASVVGMERKAVPGGACACDAAAAAAPAVFQGVEARGGVTMFSAKDVQSGAMSATMVSNDAQSSLLLSQAAIDPITDKSEEAGSCAASNPATCQLNSSGQSKARRQLTDSPSEQPSSSDVEANQFSSVAGSTSTSDDTLTQVVAHRESGNLSSTDQTHRDVNPDSPLLLQQEIDRQNAQKHMQLQSLSSHEAARRDPRSTFGIQGDPPQPERKFVRMQENEQSHQQCSGFLREGYESVHTLTEEEKQWLKEQERNGTPPGRVNLWSNYSASTSRTQGNEQSHQQCSRFLKEDYESLDTLTEEEKQWLKEQERHGTPPGRVHLSPNSSASTSTTGNHQRDGNKINLRVESQNTMRTNTKEVIPKDKSNSGAYDDSMVHVQHLRNMEGERKSVTQTPALASSPNDCQERVLPLEHGRNSWV